MGEIPKLGLTEVVMSLEPAGPFVYMKSISRMLHLLFFYYCLLLIASILFLKIAVQ
ncbi:protein of unknown function [[Clostridium] ultunense Esp]|uniref:Uncharacterized protein n=1 Tax=[Clostridium] ultunense Esp TaxID=1288971 RepID=A0A1M4PMK5_9FIRM|nr:protein of unknown function [[Clostridium] ultunense Esp]